MHDKLTFKPIITVFEGNNRIYYLRVISTKPSLPGSVQRLQANIFSLATLRASPSVSVELKFTLELNSFSNASRVCDQQMKACS